MPFPWNNKKKEDLPEEIRDLEPEQLAEAIKAKAAMEKELSDLKASVGTKDQEYKDLKKQFDDLSAQIKTLQEGNDDDENENNQRQNQGPTSFLVDENKAFNERAEPLARLSIHSAAQSAYIIARDEINADPEKAPIFRKFQKEISDVVKGMSPERQIDSQVWHNALDLVAGRHVKEIRDASFWSEGGSTGGGRRDDTPPEKKEKTTLTAAEKEQAKRWGVSEKEYLESLKKTAAATVPDLGD